MKVIFDCNIYDRLAADVALTVRIRQLVARSSLSVLVTRTLWSEIVKSPHEDLAKSLPVTHIGESVALAGGRVGDRVGSGRLYVAHRGNSKQFNDALIADAAQAAADYLVTEDTRCGKRMKAYAVSCKAIGFDEFKKLIEGNLAG